MMSIHQLTKPPNSKNKVRLFDHLKRKVGRHYSHQNQTYRTMSREIRIITLFPLIRIQFLVDLFLAQVQFCLPLLILVLSFYFQVLLILFILDLLFVFVL